MSKFCQMWQMALTVTWRRASIRPTTGWRTARREEEPKVRKSIWGVPLLLLAAASWARADSITFVTPAGSSVSGLPVDASATIVTNANGTIDITLTDLEANPTSIAQLL